MSETLEANTPELLDFLTFQQFELPSSIINELFYQASLYDNREIGLLIDHFEALEEQMQNLVLHQKYEEFIKLTLLYAYPLFYGKEWSSLEKNLKLALEYSQILGDPSAESKIWSLTGTMLQFRGDSIAATAAFNKSLEIDQALNNLSSIADDLFNLAGTANDRSNYKLAKDYFERSLKIKKELGETFSTAVVLMGLAYVEAHLRAHATALAHFYAAKKLRQKIVIAG